MAAGGGVEHIVQGSTAGQKIAEDLEHDPAIEIIAAKQINLFILFILKIMCY
jgi:hypothetical protein